MANNNATVTLTFKVQADGTLKQVTDNINKSAKATDNLASAQTRASSGAAKHNQAMNGGVTSANNSARSMSRLIDTVGGNNSGLVAAYATLATNAFAVSAAFNVLRNASQVELLLKGLEVQGSRTGRNLLGVSNSIQEITKGSISAADAMKAASLGSASGLNAADLQALTTVATNASIALGRNLPDSMDRVIKGVTKLEPELLDELGLMTKLTEATENYARAQGKSAASLTGLEKRRAFVEAIKAEGEIKYAGISEQVDVNSFDQLAATFMNLTNSVLGFVAASAPVQGILDVLINSSLGLSGALILLASSMSGPINTWLSGMAIASAKAAAELANLAEKQQKVAATAVDASRGRVQRAGAVVTEATALSTRQPAAFKEIEAKRISGETLSLQEKEKAIKSLERSTTSYTSKLTKLQKSEEDLSKSGRELSQIDKNKLAAYKDEIAANTLRINSYKELAVAEKYAEKRQIAATARENRASATKFAETSKTQTSIALEAAAGGSPVKAFNAAGASISAYNQQLKATAAATAATAAASGRSLGIMQGLTPAVNAAKVSFFTLGIGIRAAGSALMAFLPYIGVIMLAFSGLQLVYEKFFVTEVEKAKTKALEELKVSTDSVSTSIKELNRLSEIDMQQGVKTSKLMEIRINALLELAEAYNKVANSAVEASKKQQLQDENLAKAEAARISDPAGKLPAIRKLDIANTAGVSFDSKALEMFQGTLEASWLGLGSWNEEGIQSIKTLDQLEKLSPQVAKRFYEAANATDSQEKKTKLLNQALQYASEEYNPLRDKLAEFTEALKAAEIAQGDFLKSLRPTTPFDNVASNFRNLTSSMSELEGLMSKQGSLAAEQFSGSFQEIVTQLGPNLAATLDKEGQITLSSYNAVGEQIARLNQVKSKSVEQEKELSSAVAIRAQYETRLGEIIPQQVADYNSLLATAQKDHILAGSLVTLAQARLGVIQRQGIVTGADVKRQMQAQNAVIAAQIAQEKLKISFIKLDLQRLQISLLEIQAQREFLKNFEERLTAGEKLYRITELGLIQAKRGDLIRLGKGDSPEAATLAAQEKVLANAQVNDAKFRALEAERLKRREKSTQEEIGIVKAGVDAAENSIAALGMGMTSATEQNVAAALQDLKVSKEVYDAKKDILNVTMARAHQEEKLANLLNMRTKDNLKTEIKAINELASQKVTERAKEFKFKEEELALNIKLAKSRGLGNQVKAYETQLDLEKRKNAADQAAIESQRAIEILNKVAIKDEEDLISRKQDILSYQEKILQAKRTEVEANRALSESEVDLSAKMRGVTDTAATDRIKAIKAAKDAYELAKEEETFKKAQIDLEFQLLKAKRALLMMEITTAQATLKSEQSKTSERIAEITKLKNAEEARLIKEREIADKNKSKDEIVVTGTVSSPLLAQLNAEEKSLASTMVGFGMQNTAFAELRTYFNTTLTGTFDEAATKMKDAITKGTETAANKLAEALATGPLVKGGLVSQMENIKERQKGRADEGVSETSAIGVSRTVLQEMDTYIESVKENLKSLGPEGEIVLATATAAQSIGSSFVDAFKTMGDASATSSEKTVAALQAVSAVIAGVASILKATSDAKIANIDKEIAAEQRRDGKSAASLEKIKMMEKKKDESARKSFNIQKKLMMAQAVVSTAAAIAMAIGQLGPIAGPIMAGVMAAMGAAQIAIIAGTSYESASPSAVSSPTSLSIGKRSDTVDLARGPNANAGGEAGYLRGAQGTGTNATNYRTTGSAYGGELMRGYGNRGFVVGEKGPEVITPETPISVTPADSVGTSQPVNATFNIHAIDSQGVQDVLVAQKGNIIKMLRDTANASGKSFMEDVNVNVYTRPSVGKL